MVTIASIAKQKQAGWGRLRLEALRQLGLFLIRYGKGRGRPAKTSADDVLPTERAWASPTAIYRRMPKMLHGSAPKISTRISRKRMSRPLKGCCGMQARSPTGQRRRTL